MGEKKDASFYACLIAVVRKHGCFIFIFQKILRVGSALVETVLHQSVAGVINECRITNYIVFYETLMSEDY